MLGVDKSKYDNLCALCAGSGADKCSKEQSKNKYVSYHGAFKCMGDGVGDVAFVKHTTTQEVVDSGGYGKVEDYEYLCKDGTREGKTIQQQFSNACHTTKTIVTTLTNHKGHSPSSEPIAKFAANTWS